MIALGPNNIKIDDHAQEVRVGASIQLRQFVSIDLAAGLRVSGRARFQGNSSGYDAWAPVRAREKRSEAFNFSQHGDKWE